jgi:hypothetical protein
MKCKEKFLVFKEYLAKGKCLNHAGRYKKAGGVEPRRILPKTQPG